MPRFVAGLDVGTQSAKVIIFDESGTAVAGSYQPLKSLEAPAPNQAVHPDDDLWDSTATAFRAAVEAFAGAGHDTADIEAIGICVIRCCRVLQRADGSLAYPVINWMDPRGDHPYAHVEEFGEVAHVTTASGYIGFRMTGKRVDTCANLIGWWPIDDIAMDWSDDAAAWESCNLERSQVYDLVKPGEAVGSLTAEAAGALGLPAGIPVVATAHDKAVEALGSGVLEPGVGLVSLGTYIAAMTHGATYVSDAESFWTFQASLPGQYLYECWGVRRGMWTISWFRDQFGAAAAAEADRNGASLEELLNAEAEQVPPGSDGLLTVHDWAAPPHAPFRRGAMIGFDGRHTRGHLYRSVLEGIALRLKTHMDPMAAELGQPFTHLVVSGGGANSDVMMQILADVHGVPTSRNLVGSAAAVGCAVNAGMHVGIWGSPVEATGAMVERGDVFTPRAENREIYDRLAALEASVHEHLDPINEQLSGM